jgi:hypothetical protein
MPSAFGTSTCPRSSRPCYDDGEHILHVASVYSPGGTTITEIAYCLRCGRERTAVTPGANRNPGDANYVRWSDDQLDLEQLRAARAAANYHVNRDDYGVEDPEIVIRNGIQTNGADAEVNGTRWYETTQVEYERTGVYGVSIDGNETMTLYHSPVTYADAFHHDTVTA